MPEVSRFLGIVIRLGLVQEWAELHRTELELCWEQARRGEVPAEISPLV